MSLQSDVLAAKAVLEKAEKNKIKTEAAVEQAQLRLDQVAAKLREEFGIETVEDAKKVLAELDSEIRIGLSEVLEKLDLIES